MHKYAFLLALSLLFSSCASSQLGKTKSATIILKTPALKFYDVGFITKYSNYIDLNIYNAGTSVLNLLIYKDRICQSTFKCLESRNFNTQYLHESYADTFMFDLFSKKNINFKDRNNKVHIKVIYSK